MTERLTPQTPDLEVWDSSLTRCVVSLDKELYSTVSLFTRVYKWVPATNCRGVFLRWTSVPSRGEKQYSQACFMLRKLGKATAIWAFGSCAPLVYQSKGSFDAHQRFH